MTSLPLSSFHWLEMQRPEAGTGAEEDGAAEEVVEEAAGEVEASVTAEAKVVQWAVREVGREAVQEAAPKVRRLEVREAFQPASPWERLPPVHEGG